MDKNYIAYGKPSEEIDFRNKDGKDCIGLIEEVDIKINPYQRNIIYVVSYNEDRVLVDGETFNQL